MIIQKLLAITLIVLLLPLGVFLVAVLSVAAIIDTYQNSGNHAKIRG